MGAGRARKAIPNSFSHLLHSPKTLIKLNDIDSVIYDAIYTIQFD